MNVNSPTDGGQRRHALFIRHKNTKPVAGFQAGLEDEFVAALGLHCDVSVIDEDFDYGAVCDRLNPDFVILSSPGGNRATPLTITNTGARPDIPRIGFMDQDPHDTARVVFFRLMDEMKIERFFTVTAAAARQSPEMTDRAYILNMFIDGDIFRDYEQEKLIPVSIFGGLMAPQFYRWRGANAVQIMSNFPTLLYTHPGYGPDISPHRFPISGADYARMLNRSHFSLSDSSCVDCVVRKHMEIPACGAVLVAPESATAASYGFKDMHNCIMDNGPGLSQKIAVVAADPALYKTIQKNGHDLVHSRYTRKQWRGIVDWYECLHSLRPGESVQQQGELGPFMAVPSGLPARSGTLSDSELTTAMKSAWQKILAGQNLDEAEESMKQVSSWGHIGEPWMLQGIIALLRGHPAQAKDMFFVPGIIRTRREGKSCFDPEEVAWLLLTAALLGDAPMVEGLQKEAGAMRHLGLRRAVWLVRSLMEGNKTPMPQGLSAREDGDRVSTHWTGQLDLQTWLGLIGRILKANGKESLNTASLPAASDASLGRLGTA